jgi:hypothetical protein
MSYVEQANMFLNYGNLVESNRNYEKAYHNNGAENTTLDFAHNWGMGLLLEKKPDILKQILPKQGLPD